MPRASRRGAPDAPRSASRTSSAFRGRARAEDREDSLMKVWNAVAASGTTTTSCSWGTRSYRSTGAEERRPAALGDSSSARRGLRPHADLSRHTERARPSGRAARAHPAHPLRARLARAEGPRHRRPAGRARHGRARLRRRRPGRLRSQRPTPSPACRRRRRLGDALRDAGSGTGGKVADAGRAGEERVHDLANLLGFLFLRSRPRSCSLATLPARIRQIRELNAAQRFLGEPTSEERRRLIAMRAAFSLPARDLVRYTKDPHRRPRDRPLRRTDSGGIRGGRAGPAT